MLLGYERRPECTPEKLGPPQGVGIVIECAVMLVNNNSLGLGM